MLATPQLTDQRAWRELPACVFYNHKLEAYATYFPHESTAVPGPIERAQLLILLPTDETSYRTRIRFYRREMPAKDNER
jgi:hypothetical protein